LTTTSYAPEEAPANGMDLITVQWDKTALRYWEMIVYRSRTINSICTTLQF
jgi:hypothetical protein